MMSLIGTYTYLFRHFTFTTHMRNKFSVTEVTTSPSNVHSLPSVEVLDTPIPNLNPCNYTRVQVKLYIRPSMYIFINIHENTRTQSQAYKRTTITVGSSGFRPYVVIVVRVDRTSRTIDYGNRLLTLRNFSRNFFTD